MCAKAVLCARAAAVRIAHSLVFPTLRAEYSFCTLSVARTTAPTARATLATWNTPFATYSIQSSQLMRAPIHSQLYQVLTLL